MILNLVQVILAGGPVYPRSHQRANFHKDQVTSVKHGPKGSPGA